MKTRGILKTALSAICLAGMLGSVSSLSALTIGDGNELGFVLFGIPTGDGDIPVYVDALRQLGLGGTTTVTISGQDNFITRSGNAFSPLDAATLISHTATSSGALTIPSGGAEYLTAKYDGPNAGMEVWYIGGLSGSLTIPDVLGQYGLSGVAFLTPHNPGGGTTGVPDGGTTVALLGFAVAGIGMLRRKLA